MKNIKFNKEKIIKLAVNLLKYLPYFCAAIFVVVMIYLSYTALVPREDEVIKDQGSVDAAKLNIEFNTSILNDISGAQMPQDIVTDSFRNPFAPF